MSRLSVALIALVIAASCYKDDATSPASSGPGRSTRVLITDSPFPFDTVQSVDVYVVSVAASPEPDTGTSADSMSWVTITEPHRQINLLALQGGTTALLGEREIPANQYRAIRVIIDGDSSRIRFKDGSNALVNWGGAGQQSIHAFVETAVDVPQGGAQIVIDFDVGRSFHFNEFAAGAFNFLPWIRAVNSAATGSIAGTVRRVSSTGAPVEHAIVSAWSAGQILSTGTTDASGHYRLAFLLPGTYVVAVDPPSSDSLGSSVDSNVVVTRGIETQHSVVLPAP
jgi:hypothetical protein